MSGKLVAAESTSCLLIALIAVVGTCSGCRPDSPVGQVRGKVLLNGKPLVTGAVITLPGSGRGAKGVIVNGEFVLSTFGANDGALVGTHKVAIVANEATRGSGPEAQAGKLLVPERYTNPETSDLTIEVTAHGPNEPLLELTSP